jgi:hypothetical protein
MKTVLGRIAKLESQLSAEQQILLVVSGVDLELALDEDRCIEILRESGFLPTGPMGVVSFLGIPKGLTADELERLLREHGGEVTSLSQRVRRD